VSFFRHSVHVHNSYYIIHTVKEFFVKKFSKCDSSSNLCIYTSNNSQSNLVSVHNRQPNWTLIHPGNRRQVLEVLNQWWSPTMTSHHCAVNFNQYHLLLCIPWTLQCYNKCQQWNVRHPSWHLVTSSEHLQLKWNNATNTYSNHGQTSLLTSLRLTPVSPDTGR